MTHSERGQRISRIILSIGLTLLGLWIARGFLPALIWAVVIAIAIMPLYARAERRWPPGKHNLLLPSLFTLGIGLLILVPIAIAAFQAASEIRDVSGWIQNAAQNGVPVPQWIYHLPFASAQAAAWWQANLATPQATSDHLHHLNSQMLIAHSRTIGSSIARRAVIFAFTLFALFFLLRDRTLLTRQMLTASERIFGPSGERIGLQMVLSVRGTIDGLVLVGIGEGIVIAIAYFVLGVPHPVLFGALTAVAAMIPFGAPLLFCVAALLLLIQDAMGSAIALVVFGFAVVFVADHFIRPALIGGATRLPFLWVLIGILGGVETFGLLGLFIGPATMAALVLLWRELVNGGPKSADAGVPIDTP
ncbi:AI-2E family transporter [Flavisphingomonas formosensis]|uniref:AI-2E family transporter n=1 Tax=Flavisphingomonas formosensis TaxID=861534 RepID=UPI0012FB7C79|nr:AI-2E family transporter [Sphingomonas formosensis]